MESITFERLVDDVFAVLDALGIERCVLAAESAGTQTALAAAHRQPQRITGLVIAAGLSHRSPVEGDPFLAGLQHAYSQTLDRFVAACVPESDSDHIKRWGRQILDRSSQAAAIALYRTASEVDLRPLLPDIRQPALLLHGAADAIAPAAEAQRLAEALPNATFKLLPGVGHTPTLTRPLEVAEEIARFFAPLAPQGAQPPTGQPPIPR